MAIGPLGNGIDPLASHRRMVEQARRVVDPMAEYRRFRERTKPVDPLGTRRILDQARRAVNPMDEYRRLLERTKPVDPMASYRQAMEQTRKVMDPMAEYRRFVERTKPVDPLGTRRILDQARMAMDPMGEYQRIVQNFSGLVGIDPASIAVEGLDDGEGLTPETAPSWLAQNPALVVTLLSIAWCCGWLLAKGADIERVGGLLLAALGLAAYLAEKQGEERS
jgi:hypothetical protein